MIIRWIAARRENLKKSLMYIQSVYTIRGMLVKIVKIGNSYAVRIPKKYIGAHGLKEGSTILLPEQHKGNVSEALEQFRQLSKRGGIKSIPDPVEWQRQQRSEWTSPWEELDDDSC
jgi:hypothetical protein